MKSLCYNLLKNPSNTQKKWIVNSCQYKGVLPQETGIFQKKKQVKDRPIFRNDLKI